MSALCRLYENTSYESLELDPVIRNDHSGLIVWDIAPSAYLFTVPSFVLKTRWKLTKSDGSDLPHNTNIAIIDLRELAEFGLHSHYSHLYCVAAHFSAFKTLRLRINEFQVQNIAETFALHTYLTCRLTYSKSANESWRYDTVGQALDTPGLNDVANNTNMACGIVYALIMVYIRFQGWKHRQDMIAGSRPVTTIGELPIEVCVYARTRLSKSVHAHVLRCIGVRLWEIVASRYTFQLRARTC